jgi:hypothetical protein
VPQLEDFLSFFQEFQTITFSSENPVIKTSTLSIIVEELLSRKKQVQYIDLDLQYSSMICNSLKFEHSTSEMLQVFRSGDFQTIDLILSLLNSSDVKNNGVIIVDSINTLQTLLQEREHRTDFVKSNHEAAILITLIQEFAYRYSKALILANVIRPRPRKTQNSRTWDMELSGGRMIKLKSDVILSASSPSENLHTESRKIELQIESVAEKYKGAFREGQSFVFSLSSYV